MRGDKHMAKKWISLVLAAIMVLLLVPAALAEESSAESTASAELNGTTLTASGGPYSFDGKAHAVTCRLENGKEYKNIYYSVDNGKTWTKTAPRLTDPGQLTVTVRAVKENGRYVLGIECDNSLYDGAKSTRERDYHRQKYLESRGWRIRRVWSNHWWNNPDAEIEAIVTDIISAKIKS